MSDKTTIGDQNCKPTGFFEKLAQDVHLTDSKCNQSVTEMKPADTSKDALPNVFIEGVEAVKRQGREGSINKQEAEMLKEI